jgi:hypothetical protein
MVNRKSTLRGVVLLELLDRDTDRFAYSLYELGITSMSSLSLIISHLRYPCFLWHQNS